MKAICVVRPNELEIQDRPIPTIGHPDEVLVKVRAAGICGSDMHIYHGTSPVATYPRVIGHEIACEVLEAGSGVKVLRTGDHVVMDPVIHCGHCYQCSIDRRNVCENLLVRGVHVDGGYQEYLVLPEKSVHKIPKTLPWQEAIMIEPFTIAEQVCWRAQVTNRDKVFIMGAGPVGLSILKMAKMAGATCFISDIQDHRLELARNYGADAAINACQEDVTKKIMDLTANKGVTVVVDAVCTVQSIEQALEYVCPAGRVIALGFHPSPSSIAQLQITAREIDIRGSRLHNNKFPSVIDHVTSGKLMVGGMVTHSFPFNEIHEAIKLIEDEKINNGKVMLEF